MERKKYALDLISSITGNVQMAETILERLTDDGLLHLGYGKAEVDQIVGTFKELFMTSVITKQDRAAANRLANTHGVKSVIQVMKMLAQFGTGQYAPTVNNVAQLEQKWVSVMGYLRKTVQGSEEIEV